MTRDEPAIALSIIIPTYNRLWSLPAAIASCPQREDIEIVVIDDGSADGTWEWLSAQPGIVALRQSNWGKPAAANAGFAAARGRYVRFLDSDDLLIAGSALAQLDAVLSSGADISVAGYRAWYAATGSEVLHGWADCGDFLAQQLGECDSSHYSAYLFRRVFIADIRHRPEYAFRDDRMFVLECALAQPTVVEWPQPTLIHRHHDRPRIQFQPGSTAVVTHWQEHRMWRKVAALLDERGLSTPRRRAAIAQNLWPLALRIAARDRAEARGIIAWIATLDPDFVMPDRGVGRLYRLLGFSTAQTLINAARTGRNSWRRMARR